MDSDAFIFVIVVILSLLSLDFNTGVLEVIAPGKLAPARRVPVCIVLTVANTIIQ